MNEEQKSLELARLMRWDIKHRNDIDEYHIIFDTVEELKPYESCNTGLAQFAKIQLEFPSFVDNFHTETKQSMTSAFYTGWWHDKKPTQKSILDEILIINGVAI